MKTVQKIVIVLCILAAFTGFLFFDAWNIAPKRINVRNETLSSEKIPSQLDGVRVLFFSDLEYGTFMDEERLAKLCSRINLVSPDVILFGGDLYNEAASASDESDTAIVNALSTLKAPLGKFAVLGDNDHASEDMLARVSGVLNRSEFEILNNRSVNLHNTGSQSISLIGLDNGLNGMQDIASAYSGVSLNSYNIAFCHTPDTAAKLPEDLTDYYLTGHSHGGQAYWFFGAMYTPAMAVRWLRGTHYTDGFTIDITNGVGTTQKDVRFLCDAEVVLYRLKGKKEEPVPAADLTPEEQPPAEEQPAEEPVYEEPVYEEPVYEEPVYEEPVYEEPAEEEYYEEPQEEEYTEEPAEEEYYEEPQEEEYYEESGEG